jgi:bifunctional non-homologous end joining protein LigD
MSYRAWYASPVFLQNFSPKFRMRAIGDEPRDFLHRATALDYSAVTARFPSWLEPMAATLTADRFTGPDWVFERKWDGIRLLAFKEGADVRLFSRNRLPQNASYPAFVRAVARLPVRNVILDGEATGVWNGRDEVGYHVFDILWLDERDLTSLPLDTRRECLSRLPLAAPLQLVARLDDAEPWERARQEGWEGVIAKRRDSVYEHRRSPHWLKMKVEASQELVVGGFTDPKGKRVGLGALLVGYFDGDDLAFAGKIGTGFDTKLLLELRQRLNALELPTSPFTKAVGLPRLGVHWVKPEIVVQVAFMEWTTHGKLRHPRLLGLRLDKAAHEVTRETT